MSVCVAGRLWEGGRGETEIERDKGSTFESRRGDRSGERTDEMLQCKNHTTQSRGEGRSGASGEGPKRTLDLKMWGAGKL